jgi:hypothetical protein
MVELHDLTVLPRLPSASVSNYKNGKCVFVKSSDELNTCHEVQMLHLVENEIC